MKRPLFSIPPTLQAPVGTNTVTLRNTETHACVIIAGMPAEEAQALAKAIQAIPAMLEALEVVWHTATPSYVMRDDVAQPALAAAGYTEFAEEPRPRQPREPVKLPEPAPQTEEWTMPESPTLARYVGNPAAPEHEKAELKRQGFVVGEVYRVTGAAVHKDRNTIQINGRGQYSADNFLWHRAAWIAAKPEDFRYLEHGTTVIRSTPDLFPPHPKTLELRSRRGGKAAKPKTPATPPSRLDWVAWRTDTGFTCDHLTEGGTVTLCGIKIPDGVRPKSQNAARCRVCVSNAEGAE